MITRDVRWLGKSYGEYFKSSGKKLLEYTDLEDSEEEDSIIVRAAEIEVKKQIEEPRTIITRSKALMDNLEEESSDSESEEGVFVVLNNEISDPTSFKEAYYDKDHNKRKAWREAIKKEINDIERCHVWSLIKKKDVPNERKLIGSKWVFKEKRDGIFRARLVALGYSQVAGIDFTGNYSPVVHDSSFRIVLLLIAKLGLKAWSLDIETAFLNGNLQEEIYMKLPEGYGEIKGETSDTMCLKLHKSLYGLVQAAREWNIRFKEEVIKLGFEINNFQERTETNLLDLSLC